MSAASYAALLAALTDEQRELWQRHQNGDRNIPMGQLPRNGSVCAARVPGGHRCDWELLIDGTCLNSDEHKKGV